jgi:beta-barrel assembly-enhancing protease
MLKKTIFLGITFLIQISLWGQIEFNNYKTIRCSGTIPKDFSQLTTDKISEDSQERRENLNKTQEKIFLEGIHYGIDGLLHSGLVIYGDPISEYVENIADKLLAKRPEVRKKLRFYTLKSNATNAFSTDQGIVFVTTGLISQLTNEAQLAFVLAHEISHYTEKHVVATFEYKTRRTQQDDQIRQLSTYSKDKEFEADSIGIKLYYETGYAKEELTPAFDVLMYSYLPFDEIEVPVNYFNNEYLFVPENLFPKKKYEIKAIENYDDTRSSHPNIKKRKSHVEESLKNFRNWGDQIFLLGEDRFHYIRNLCRFESIRTDILDANYVDALYSIFLLERQFPESTYLKKMKAHCWLGMAQYKHNGSISDVVERNSELEGEIAALHYVIKKLKNEALYAFALREIVDIRKQLPPSDEMNEIYQRMLHVITTSKSFDLDKFSDKTFSEAAEEFLNSKHSDTNKVEVEKSEKLSKYDRIKNKRNKTDPTVFDSTKFYYYCLSDLIKDTLFVDAFKSMKDSISQVQDQRDRYYAMSYKERLEFDEKNKKEKTFSDFILVEPIAISYKKGKINYESSEKMEEDYRSAINTTASYFDYSIYNLNSKELKSIGTTGFNERSILSNFLMQMTQDTEIDILPVDYDDLRAIKKNYGTGKVIFTIVEHTYAPRVSPRALWFIFYPPGFLSYIPIPFMTGNETELNLIIVDVEKAKIEESVSYYFKEPMFKQILEARMYDIFKNLNSNTNY